VHSRRRSRKVGPAWFAIHAELATFSREEHMKRLGSIVLGLLVLQVGCGGDDDDDRATEFDVQLTTAMEVPVCTAAGASATGMATVTISADGTMVSVSNLTFSGLSGAATGAHIHTGASGVAGGVVFNLGTSLTPPISATFTAANFPSPAPAGVADFTAFIAAMKTGGAYVNVHTAACATGEIRGQID
jgi:hypothetical protein